MFTGIIEEIGRVRRILRTEAGIELWIRTAICGEDMRKGDSLSVNGVCLTAVELAGRGGVRDVRFDLLRETWDRTNLRGLKEGDGVNLERAVRADGRMGGHIVSGHIDDRARIVRWEKRGSDYFLEIELARKWLGQVVPKGSIAIDGISLTIATVTGCRVGVWIIPHTREVTALRDRNAGDWVNIETDLVAKYIENLVVPARGKKRKPLQR